MKAIFLVLLLCVGSAQAKVFQFLYLEASEGNASGGHVAVQLADTVYHYQYDNALIRLFKRDANTFRVDYQFLQNRSLHSADINVSDATYNLINDYFNRRFFQQTQHLKHLQASQHDQALLRTLLQQKTGKQVMSAVAAESLPHLKGAGLFYSDDVDATKTATDCHTTPASANILAKVKQQLEHRFGIHFLPEKIMALRKALSLLSPSHATTHYAFSERYSDVLNGLLALQVLQKSQPLQRSACFAVNSATQRLTDADIKQAQVFQQTLLQSVQSLMVTTRPDWGYALFVTLARLMVIEQSIQTRQWTFLDDTDEKVASIPNQQLALYAEHIQKQRRHDLTQLHTAIADLGKSSQAYERRYVHLEMAANRNQHWLNSDKTGDLRYDSEQPLPDKSVSINRFLVTDLPTEQLALALRHQQAVTERLIDDDKDQNTYQLVTKNCVTMLLELINAAVSGKSEQLLGGYIDPKVNFIPFQAFDAVLENYKVANSRVLPAYRQQKLTTLYAKEVDSWVYARESNIFSSSLYNHNPDDAWFVFFTDDTLWFRPLFGAVNTLAATSQSLLGLLRLPFDGGKEVKIGVRGILTSLPELAFFNIRKGSYPYLIEP